MRSAWRRMDDQTRSQCQRTISRRQRIGIERPDHAGQQFDGEHRPGAELRRAFQACLALSIGVLAHELRAPLDGDVLGLGARDAEGRPIVRARRLQVHERRGGAHSPV